MSGNVSEDMRQLIASQQEAIANDPNYPLNNFQRNMKVGGIPTGQERQKLEQEVMAVAEACYNIPSTSSVLTEKDQVSPTVAKRSLERQRRIVEQMKANRDADRGVTSQPMAKPRPPEPQEEARLRANKVLGDIVTQEEQALIRAGMSNGELGFVDGAHRRNPSTPLEFDDPVDIELSGGSSNDTNPNPFAIPQDIEDEFEDEM